MPYQTATRLVADLRVGKCTSEDLVEAAIARITTVDVGLNAVVVRDFVAARHAAKAADAARSRGDDRPLLGLPMTVKEGLDVAGLSTTWGIPGTQNTIAQQDSVLVSRLKAAGAIILGKSNVPVMLADWQTANPVYGVTNNPWDITRTPGGSSGGAAAALAAGMTPLEFGSDLAGSLRIPASFCGVFAHRPSYGLVPMQGFAPPGAPRDATAPGIDQSVLGPMARSAGDLMLALDVIAGPDDTDAVAYSLQLPPPRTARLKDFRVLILDEHPLVPTADAVRAALVATAGELEKAGCKVGRRSPQLPDLSDLSSLFVELLAAFSGADMPGEDYEAAVKAAKAMPTHSRDFMTADTRGTAISHRDWIEADRTRFALAAQWRRLFQSWDVVLCPAAPTVAFHHDARPFEQRLLRIDDKPVPYAMLPIWTGFPTPTGQPVTTMPIGRDPAGMPIGMQIIGPRLEDRTPLAFAALVEGLMGGFAPPIK
jgi:amidase